MSNDHDGTDGTDKGLGRKADGSETTDATADDAVEAVDAVEGQDDADEAGDADEFVDADQVDDGAGDRDPALVGATAGSARAAARRSAAVRAGRTAPKAAATNARGARESKGNVFSRLGRFLREVVAELRKVIWPTRKQMITYTLVVIVFVVFMVALVAGLDVLFAQGVLTIFG